MYMIRYYDTDNFNYFPFSRIVYYSNRQDLKDYIFNLPENYCVISVHKLSCRGNILDKLINS